MRIEQAYGNWLAFGIDNGTVVVMMKTSSLRKGQFVKTFKRHWSCRLHQDHVTVLQFVVNDRNDSNAILLISGSRDGTLCVTNVVTQKLVFFKEFGQGINVVCIQPCLEPCLEPCLDSLKSIMIFGLQKALGNHVENFDQGTIRAFSTTNFEEIVCSKTTETVTALSTFQNSQPCFMVGFLNGNLLLVDINSLKVRKSFKGHTASIWNISVCESKEKIATISQDGSLRIWNVDTCSTLESIQFDKFANFSLDACAFLQDKYLVFKASLCEFENKRGVKVEKTTTLVGMWSLCQNELMKSQQMISESKVHILERNERMLQEFANMTQDDLDVYDYDNGFMNDEFETMELQFQNNQFPYGVTEFQNIPIVSLDETMWICL